ncbi:LysR family transcriptional regulator [Ruminococcaceae bacterium OttesenSCG-928-L11]|nr:LysR family transcriptional regulator [Ruminococcaceae bacterium OttesenSCG-928-L11]
MTLQQLKYVIEVAAKGSINEAAKSLFLSQPSLSNAIRDLEEELNLTLFLRTNRGIKLSTEGAEFLGYARQVVQQAELLEEKYLHNKPSKQKFAVSTQHYAFTANAFVDLIKEFGSDEYEFTLRETKTYDIIDDVRHFRSDLGVLYLSSFNETVIRKLLRESNLLFTEIFAVRPHIFLGRDHPLAGETSVRLAQLEEYPCLTFEQGEHNSFYFSEEILSTLDHKKSIKITDRAAIINLLIGVDAYTIATGVFPYYLHGDDIIAIPLEVDETMRIGVVTHRDAVISPLAEIYIAALRRIADTL